LLPAGAFVGIRAVVHGGAAIRALARSQPLDDALHDVVLDPLNLAFFQLAGFGAVIVGGLYAFSGDRGARQTLAIHPVPMPIIVFALIGGAALQFPLAELGNLMAEIFPRSVEEQLTQRLIITPDGPLSALAIVFAVAVVAPVTEELLFRGLLLPGLAERYGAPFALGATSLGFGLIHGEPGAIAYATVAGLVLGAITHRTGSVLPALAMHGAINAMPVLVPERLMRIRGFNTISEEVYHLPLPLLLGSGLVAAAAILALARFNDLMADGQR
jgi:membrane protease YdiL (CAAX protease family)